MTAMPVVVEILASLLIVLGGAFALVGSWGLVRLPSLMTRLHGPTKATTLGVGGCLLASIVVAPFAQGGFSGRELLITLFLFMTAPVTANMIAKAHLHRRAAGLDPPAGTPEGEPPPTGTGQGWATLAGAVAPLPPAAPAAPEAPRG
jgi:multicomponent K+:H+ antiporter subunit G